MGRLRWLAFLTAAILLVSYGCSSSSKASKGPGPSAPTTAVTTASTTAGAGNSGNPQEGVTPTSVTIGGVVVASGEGGFTEAGTLIGFKAYIDSVNAQGGVYGRKINFLGAQDDGYSATADVQIVQNLVQQKHVFAVVPVASNQFAAGPFLVQNNVPFVGPGTATAYCGTPNGFGFYGCSVPSLTPGSLISPSLYKVVDDVLNNVGKKPAAGQQPSLAIVFNSSGSGPVSVKPAMVEAKGAGFNVTYDQASIPAAGVADYSPYVAQILKSNHGGPPDAAFLLCAGTNVVAMHAALVAAGFKGPIFDATTYAPSTTQNAQLVSALQGEYSVIQVQPWEAHTPASDQMLQAMRQLQGAQYIPDNYAEQGYEAAGLFVAMLKATGPDLTRANFLSKVNAGFTFSIPGLFGELKFPQNHTQTAGCVAAVQLKGSAWTLAQSLQCYPNVPVPAG